MKSAHVIGIAAGGFILLGIAGGLAVVLVKRNAEDKRVKERLESCQYRIDRQLKTARADLVKATGFRDSVTGEARIAALMDQGQRAPDPKAVSAWVTAHEAHVKELEGVKATCSKFAHGSDDADTLNRVAKLPPEPKIETMTLVERMNWARDWEGVVTLIKPFLKDSREHLDDGTKIFIAWAAQRTPFNRLYTFPWWVVRSAEKADYDEAMKDIDASRGKIICGHGKVVQIEAEDIGGGMKVFLGGMFDGSVFNGRVIRFAALGSTKDINRDTTASFCGVLTGKYTYSNTQGGTTHALFAVGVFPVEENRGIPNAEACNVMTKCGVKGLHKCSDSQSEKAFGCLMKAYRCADLRKCMN